MQRESRRMEREAVKSNSKKVVRLQNMLTNRARITASDVDNVYVEGISIEMNGRVMPLLDRP